MALNKIKVNDTTTVNTGVVYDITKATGQSYDSLSAALGTDGNNVPSEVREGGMTIRFVYTSDNKYVQYRLMADEWSTTKSDWQGDNSIPTIANYTTEADLDISDEQGNVLARFAGGHLRVKNFSSADVLESIQAILSNIGFDNIPEFDEESDYAVGDIVRYGKYVYIFTSAHTAGEWDDTESEKTVLTSESQVEVIDGESKADLDISDEQGNVLARFANGHIQVKNFNSRDAIIRSSNFSGLTASIIGDSISTFENYPKSENSEYPTNSSSWTSPVITDDDMWWKKVLSKMDMQMNTLNAYGGRRFTYGGSFTSFIDAATDFGNPDVVFVFGGINEILHTSGNSLGDYDFGFAEDKTKFRHALQMTITNIRSTVPNIKAIIFLTPLMINRNRFSAAANGISYYDLVDSIKTICEAYGVICIETHKCGITENNYSVYLGDGIHPNGKGMTLLANYICAELDKINIKS